MIALKDLMGTLGSAHIDCRQDGAGLPTAPRAAYLLNSTIAGLETADAVLLVGTNLRWEAPLVNTRLRKAWLQNGLRVGVIGPQFDLTYPAAYLGAGPATLRNGPTTHAHAAARTHRCPTASTAESTTW